MKCEGEDSLFKLWRHAEKELFAEAVKAASSGRRKFRKPAKAVLEDYVHFCAREINNVLIGYKMAVPKALWTLDRKQSRALSTTAVNGIIFCLRTLLEQNKTKDLDGYKTGFAKLTQDFTPKKFKYKSSHWKDLGLGSQASVFLNLRVVGKRFASWSAVAIPAFLQRAL